MGGSPQHLRFKGGEYLLINAGNDRGPGAIATQGQWDDFDLNFAHLCEDGQIRRFGTVIGSRADIEWLDEESPSCLSS